MEPKSLATIGHQVDQKFAKLVLDTDRSNCSGYIREILTDQMQRFNLWAGNMALCSYGHHSLDYRCRDAPKVYEYGRQLLTDLEDTLDSIIDECNPMQMEAQTMSDEAEEESEGLGPVESDTSLDGEHFMDDETPQKLDELLAKLASDNVRTTIDRLYRLSFRIRNPATRLGFSEAKRYRLTAEDGADLMESVTAIDLKHIDDLMAKHLRMSPEESRNHFLVKRLAKANTNRRQQFGLWRTHRSKVEQWIKRTRGSKNIESHKKTDTTSQQTPDTMSQPSTATRIDASTGLDDSRSVFSSSTCSTVFSEDQGWEIIIPRLPDKFRGKDFECPYCYFLCPGCISDGSRWKSHVFRDLRPYICTYEYCTEADQQYDSITDWIAHEYYNHNVTMHNRTYSGDFLASQQEEIPRPPGLYDVCREQCPICDEERPSVSHVGHHLRKIAAFTLPRPTILEDDIAPISQVPKEANLESDEDLAERPSEFELEDAEDDFRLNIASTSKQGPSLRNERLAEQQAKQREMPLPQSINVATKTAPAHLSFYVRIEPLSPNFDGEPIRHMEAGHWVPPYTPNGITNGRDPILLLLWKGGRNIIVPEIDLIQDIDLDRNVYRVATIFTQYPDTPYLLSVPLNARTRNVNSFGQRWQITTFNHVQVRNSNAYYSYISSRGSELKIAAPGSPKWIPQLLSTWYEPSPRDATRIQSGLIGELPLLFALAAFSAPPESLGVLLSSMQPGNWTPHGLPTGHIPMRGMAVTVYLDPLNPEGSTPQLLTRLENGEFGPFYGP